MSKFLEVKMVSVCNLPKMDMFGTCDPFCKILFCGEQNETKVIKNTYAADFNETFRFDLSGGKSPSAMSIEVLDWDRVGSADVVGKTIVVDSAIFDVMKKAGWQEFEYEVISPDGKPAMGHNKLPTALKVAFRYVDTTPPPLSPNAPNAPPEARESTRFLEIKVINACNLPKMDTFGTCDPFCRLDFCDENRETAVIKSTYSPEWNEAFVYDLSERDATSLTGERSWQFGHRRR
jgi:Ca2+-dependent lipid-binding protein